MNVITVSNYNEFAALRDEWNALLEKSVLDSFFLTHEWLFTWWQVYGGGCNLAVLLCRCSKSNELVGIFPFYIKKISIVPKVVSFRFLGSEFVTSDYLEPIVVAGHEEDVYIAIFNYLRAHKSDWNVLELTDVLEDSRFNIWLQQQSEVAIVESDNNKVCPYITLPGDWEKYVESRPANTRRNIRRYRSYLEKAGQVQLEFVSDLETLMEAWKDMVRLHQGRKIQMGITGRFISQEYDIFHKTICKCLLLTNQLQLVFLKLDGVRVAFNYSFIYRGRVHAYQSGFDTDWGKLSIGSVLLGHVLQRSIEEKCCYFDFLRGDEKYKYDWGVQERRLVDITIYGTSVSSKVHHFKTAGLTKMKQVLKKVLPDRIIYIIKKLVKRD